MALHVGYDTSLDALLITTEGTVGSEELCQLRDTLINHPHFRTNINQLFDATAGQLNLSTENLQVIASHYSSRSNELGNNRKLALLVAKDLDFGRMRQYEVFFDAGPNVKVQAFRDLIKAREWLRN